jgi:hypothetical protein
VREEVRRKLEELRSRLGMSSPNDVIAFLLNRYEELTDISVKLEKLLTDISVRLERLLTDRSVSTPPSLTDRSVSNPPALTDTSVSSGSPSTIEQQPKLPTTAETAATKAESMADSHIWCRKKAEIRNLKGFLEWVEHNYELLDWWEEGERYCFETKRKPEKGKRRGGE